VVSRASAPLPLRVPAMRYAPSDAIPLLERTPSTLRALLAGLPDAWTDATEGPGTWSPVVVVAHLLSAERTNWIVRARAMVDATESSPTLPAFDRDAPREHAAESLAALLDAFAGARAANLATLAGWRLGDAQLARTGVHPEFGTVTLGQLLATWVAHDLTHLAQIARVMAAQYRDQVGPWRAYLRVLG